jgi:hypothetical protein
MDSNPGLSKLIKIYEKLGYIDQYGGSVVIFILVTIILIIIINYCISKSNAEEIIQDWPNQRCNPLILPYAGYITHPEGTTAAEYTKENFNFCTQQILSSITGPAVEPYAYIVSVFYGVINQLNGSVQYVRAIFDRIRNVILGVIKNIMNRLLNIVTPLQNIIIGAKDMLNKTHAILTTILFSAYGAYYAFKSLLGAIAQFIANILIALAIIIAILFTIAILFPPAAIPAGVLTGIFLLTSIPFALLLAFMGEYLGIYGYRIPRLKCFDKNTLIQMNDGTIKKICEIQVGDILENNNEVTACVKVETKGSTMYYLNNIIVSDTHIVKYEQKWIPISKHPNAIKIAVYNEPFLFCLNTSNKIIVINKIVFTDWDEIYNASINNILHNNFIPLYDLKDIHCKLDSGFEGFTKIKLHNGIYKNIKDIEIGEKLQNGEQVYGLVIVNGNNIDNQYTYNLGETSTIIGGPNLVIYDKKISVSSTLDICDKIKLDRKNDKLYHLLTDKKTFTVQNIQFHDYNAAIDIFLEKNDSKLLSMKYV